MENELIKQEIEEDKGLVSLVESIKDIIKSSKEYSVSIKKADGQSYQFDIKQ